MSTEIDDFGFDPIDTALATRLRAAAPEAGDPDAILATMRPRLVQARRRRQTGFVAAGAAALALLAGVAFAVADTAPRGSVDVPPANHSTVPGPQQTDSTPVTEPDPAETETETETESPSRTSGGMSSVPAGTPAAGSESESGSGSATTPTTDDDSSGSGSNDSPEVDDDGSDDSNRGPSSGSGDSGSGSRSGSGSGGSDD